MRGTRCAMAVLSAVFLLSSSLVPSAVASQAVAKRGHLVLPASQRTEFSLRGSNGFSISVQASGHQVSLTARKGALSASYAVPGRVSPKRIKAVLPGLGLVSVRFHPRGRPHRGSVLRNCKGASETVQPGRFIGSIEFEGEQGYTTVHASRVKGKEVTAPKQICEKENGKGRSPLRITTISAESRGELISLLALRTTLSGGNAPGFSGFLASVVEPLGRMVIVRFTEASAATSAFTTSEEGGQITSATITPPKPFTGSATYEKKQGSPATWTGSLTTTFLGRGEVSLTGPQFTAKISQEP